MANDALDPGPNGDYPWFPRKADGTPDYERFANVELKEVRSRRRLSPFGEAKRVLDLKPRHPDGTVIDVPTIPPGQS